MMGRVVELGRMKIISRPYSRVRALAVICGSLAVAMGAQGAESKDAPVKLSAMQIADRNVLARGGVQAWRQVRAMSWSGQLEAGIGDSAARSARYVQAAAPTKKNRAEAISENASPPLAKQVQLPFTLTLERPRKSRLELEFAGKTAIQVFDGTNGWKLRPFLNRSDVEPFSTDETRAESAKEELDGPLVDYAAKGTAVSFEAVEPVDGSPAYRLKLVEKNGTIRHVWIDSRSFLDVKVEGTPRRMDGHMRSVATYQRDFRRVSGVMIPFSLETAVEGYRDTHKMTIEKVAVNPSLRDTVFSRPGA